MKRSGVFFAVLLGTSLPFVWTTPAHAQVFEAATPRQRAGPPEESVGCPVPTLQECQAEGYLEEDPCGILQSDNEWTCWQLLDGALGEDESQAEVGIVAYEIDDLGVSNSVIPYPEDPLSSQEPVYVADMSSFSSQAASVNIDPPSDFAFDIYAVWENNGNQVTTCNEYVYEKYFDQTEFERLVGTAQHDYRRVFEIAFDAQGVGSRRLNDAGLEGFDGTAYALMFPAFPRPKNEFFRLAAPINMPGDTRVAGAPDLARALRDYNAQGQLIYERITSSEERITETWAWHLAMSETLSVEGKKELGLTYRPPADAGPNNPFNLQIVSSPGANGDEDVNETIAPWTGTVPEDQSGGKFLRRYLDAELNEFYDLQRRLLRRFREWYRADRRFRGSGWTVDRIAEEEPGSLSSLTQVSRDVPPFPGGAIQVPPQFQFEDTGPGSVLPPNVSSFDGIGIEASEDIVRRRILEDIIQLYGRAEAAGCLESGLTPCDWSPKLFARTVLHRFNDLREADYDRCNGYVSDGDLSRVTNLDIRFIDEPEDRCPEVAAEFNCGVQTGPTITRAGFDRLLFDVESCQSQIPAYLEEKAKCEEQIAIEEAQQRLFAIQELIEPETGTIRNPGIGDGGSEDKGNTWFGLEYGWEYRFGSVLDARNDAACDLELFAGGFFDLSGRAFRQEVPIVDALAEVNSEERRADIFFEVLGIPIFPAVEQRFDVDTTIRVNLVTSVSRDRDLASGSLRFFVGPIPLRLAVGVSGGGGVRLDFDTMANGFGGNGDAPGSCPSGTVGAGVEPYLQVSGFVEAGIDIVVAAAGVRGDLTLIRAAIPFDAELTIGIDEDDPFGLGFPANLNLSVETSLGIDINTMSGSFEIFGRIGPCPFCKRASKTLFRWDGLSFERDIFAQDYDVYVGDLITARSN